jgi:hypothetical protein
MDEKALKRKVQTKAVLSTGRSAGSTGNGLLNLTKAKAQLLTGKVDSNAWENTGLKAKAAGDDLVNYTNSVARHKVYSEEHERRSSGRQSLCRTA